MPRLAGWIAAALIAATLAAGLYFLLVVRPAPPRSIAMATGAPGSAYEAFGERYRDVLARHGVELRLVPSAGSVDNLRLLDDPSSGISVAMVQGGVADAKAAEGLLSLGTMFYEPVWIFVRGPLPADSPHALRGKRLFLGQVGSGSRKLGLDLMAAVGFDPGIMRIVDMPTKDVPAAMRRGGIDVAILVAPWESAQVHELLTADGVTAASFPRADAHVALRPFLSKLVVPQGVADLKTNRPPRDLVLVASKANLVVRGDLHPALQYLLLEAAAQVHSAPGIFQKAGQFPAAEPIGFALSDEARQYYRTGPPFLMRYMPFWMAVLVGRLLVVLIPVLGVLLPLVRLTPSLYGWYVRRRIFLLYGELKFLEREMESPSGTADTAALLARLDRLESRANHLRVPTMFSHFLYTLRVHINLVRGRLQQHGRQAASP